MHSSRTLSDILYLGGGCPKAASIPMRHLDADTDAHALSPRNPQMDCFQVPRPLSWYLKP